MPLRKKIVTQRTAYQDMISLYHDDKLVYQWYVWSAEGARISQQANRQGKVYKKGFVVRI